MRFGDLLPKLREWVFRLWGMWRPGRRDQDFEEELRLHLEIAEDGLRRQGLSAKDAARLARARWGGSAQAMDTLRDQQGFPWIGALWMDLKLGLRMLPRAWGLTLVGGMAISVVIAIAASLFSVMDRVEGSSLPLDEGDRLIAIQPYDLAGRGLDTFLEDFRRWRRELRSVVDIGAYRTMTNLFLAVPGGSVGRVSVAAMTSSAFGLARVHAYLGRGLVEDDEQDGAEPVVVIAFEVWRSQFLADPDVLGQQIQLDGTSYTVVGVMPAGFAFPVNHRFWIPLSTDPLAYRNSEGPEVFVIARLAPDIAIETARAEVATIGLLPSKPSSRVGGEVQTRVVPYAFTFTDQIRDNRWQYRLVMMLIALLLVPPCANLAILLYARNVARQEEFATRYTLGASRRRIVGQLFVESLVLAVLAAGVGLFIAREVLSRFQSVVDQEFGSTMPFWMEVRSLFAALHVGPAINSGVAERIWEIGNSVDPNLRIKSLRPLKSVNEQNAFINRMQNLAPAAASLIVLLFSVTGIHTLTAFTVATRTREIGIRSALGAHPLLEVLGRALTPVAVGSLVGLLGACLVGVFLSNTIDEMAVGGVLAVALVASAVGMIAIACVASTGPVRRALSVDPTEALREG